MLSSVVLSVGVRCLRFPLLTRVCRVVVVQGVVCVVVKAVVLFGIDLFLAVLDALSPCCPAFPSVAVDPSFLVVVA